MESPMHLPQVLHINLGVDLGRGDILVTEHLLHVAQARATLEKVSGKGMPENVRCDLCS